MEPERPAIYRPRKPHASPLWQCVSRHLPELRASGRVRRAVEENVLRASATSAPTVSPLRKPRAS